jgi:hypothetical protein
MLSLDDFQPIKLEDKPLFDKHHEKYPPTHSDNVFTTLISWMDYSDYHFTFLDENLLIYSNINSIIRFRPPSGKFKKDIFDQVLNLAKKQNSDYPLGVIDIKTKEWMSKIYTKIRFERI